MERARLEGRLEACPPVRGGRQEAQPEELRRAGRGLGFPGNRPRMWLLGRLPSSSQGPGSGVSSTSATEAR